MHRIAIAAATIALAAVPAWPQGDSTPPGWFKAGRNPDDYDVGVDRAVKHGGNASAFVKSRSPNAAGFGTLMQRIAAQQWLGKRVRLAGYLRTDKVEKSGVLWMRIDGQDRTHPLGFDNMQDRGLHGTVDWVRVQIVLDVPRDAVDINFGIMLSGAGQVWADDLSLEVVTTKTPTTGTGPRVPSRPLNLDFERPRERES
ncbi:MAG TPA: hypothetical protein VGN09_20745 [Vicinamibacteria bacterium]|jgi:hypothetical protein